MLLQIRGLHILGVDDMADVVLVTFLLARYP